MESLSHADIFFVITGISVIVLASAVAVFIVYAIMFARDIRYVVRIVREHVDRIGGDVERLRSMIAAKDWFHSVLGFFQRKDSKRTSSRRKVGDVHKETT
jgi:hypothetical protein